MAHVEAQKQHRQQHPSQRKTQFSKVFGKYWKRRKHQNFWLVYPITNREDLISNIPSTIGLLVEYWKECKLMENADETVQNEGAYDGGELKRAYCVGKGRS